jgi:hypothetical protein
MASISSDYSEVLFLNSPVPRTNPGADHGDVAIPDRAAEKKNIVGGAV